MRQCALVHYASATDAVRCIFFTAAHRTHSYARSLTEHSSLIKTVPTHLSRMAHFVRILLACSGTIACVSLEKASCRAQCVPSQPGTLATRCVSMVRYMLTEKLIEVRCERYEVRRLRRAHTFSANVSAPLQVPILLGQVIVTLP